MKLEHYRNWWIASEARKVRFVSITHYYLGDAQAGFLAKTIRDMGFQARIVNDTSVGFTHVFVRDRDHGDIEDRLRDQDIDF